MAQGLNKEILQSLSQTKLDDARILFDANRYSNAYYLAGYSIEFAFKACIAGRMEANTIPDKKFINSIYTHSLSTLVGISGLSRELKEREDGDPEFHFRWGVVSKWSEQKRYDVTDRSTAHFFIEAIDNEEHGVLPWIKNYW